MSNERPAAGRSRAKRGGPRPGAGAPRGNLNALKSGRHSKQVKALQLALRAVPRTAGVLQRLQNTADEQRLFFARALHHYADLLALSAGAGQSKDPSKIAALQTTLLRDLAKTIKQSKPAPGRPQPTAKTERTSSGATPRRGGAGASPERSEGTRGAGREPVPSKAREPLAPSGTMPAEPPRADTPTERHA